MSDTKKIQAEFAGVKFEAAAVEIRVPENIQRETSEHACSWCCQEIPDDEAHVSSYDLAAVVHCFHADCFAAFRRWFARKPEPPC